MTHIFPSTSLSAGTARAAAVLMTLLLGFAPAALAQSTMVRGKVVDAKQQPIPGVAITIESLSGSGQKLTTKTDKKVAKKSTKKTAKKDAKADAKAEKKS